MPARWDEKFARGERVARTLRLTDAANVTQSLAGVEFRADIRIAGGGAVVASWTFSAPEADVVTITLAESVTDAIAPGTYSHDLWKITEADGPVPLATGSVTVHDRDTSLEGIL